MPDDKVIEQALYITKAPDLKYYEKKFSRIYFGNEFCQRLIPSDKALEQVIGFVSENNLDLTFVTPYFTDEGLRAWELLLGKIAAEKPGSEVVFSDWGMWRVLKQGFPGLEPVMGRLLNKMKRGPRFINFLDVLPRSTVDYFRSCSLDVPLYQQFLVRNGVKRVELDNLLQGIALNLNDSGINASLYIPYVYLTTTRLCLAISGGVHGKEDEIGIFPCKRECRESIFRLAHPVMPVPLIRKGNTIFFKNESMPEDLEKKKIDRIVFEPEVPL